MDFQFPQNNTDQDASNRATPEETKIIRLAVQPYPDGYRLRVNMEITPFQVRPYIEVILRDADEDEVASTNIVEPLGWKIEFTMHIRGELNNPYTLSVRLYYPEGNGPDNEPVLCAFNVEPPAPQPDSN